MTIADFFYLFRHISLILIIFLSHPQSPIKQEIFIGDVGEQVAVPVEFVEHANMLEFDWPALEAVAVISNLPHARYPDAHVELENRFLLELNCLDVLVVCALTKGPWRMHSHWQESLLEFLV